MSRCTLSSTAAELKVLTILTPVMVTGGSVEFQALPAARMLIGAGGTTRLIVQQCSAAFEVVFQDGIGNPVDGTHVPALDLALSVLLGAQFWSIPRRWHRGFRSRRRLGRPCGGPLAQHLGGGGALCPDHTCGRMDRHRSAGVGRLHSTGTQHSDGRGRRRGLQSCVGHLDPHHQRGCAWHKWRPALAVWATSTRKWWCGTVPWGAGTAPPTILGAP